MQLTFLGKETQGGGSPTLFATDVVSGTQVTDTEALSQMDIPDHQQ